MALYSSLSGVSASISKPLGISVFADLNAQPGQTIYQNPYDSFTVGTDGMDTIYMNYGGEVYAGGGHDRIYSSGTWAPQTIEAGAGDDVVFSGWGHDTIYGGTGADWLDGSLGNDTIYGGEGRDKVFGGNGNDQLFGEGGNDTLWSGSSQSSVAMFDGFTDLNYIGFSAIRAANGQGDIMNGGSGSDTFYLQGGNVVAIGDNGSTTPVYGYDRFVCEHSTGVDHYLISTGVDGGHVDMRALGAMTGYEHVDGYGGAQAFDKFVFGQDIVVVVSNTSAIPTFDFIG